MKCLVTGAAGFIGSHLCTRLAARGDEVWGLDDLSKGKLENIEHLLPNTNFHFVPGAITREEVRELVAKSDIIYHLAAVVGVKHYVEDPAKVIEVNVCQTLRLLELAWQLDKKVIFTSTSEIYGKNSEVPFHEGANRVYGPSSADRWCYAVSKSAAEHLCLHYARRGLPLIILRYFNVYGPGADSSAYGGVATRFINQALSNEPLTVHGDGSQTRCFTYVDDIVGGTLEAGSRREAEGKIFNLGHRRETSILELAQLILAVSGIKGEIVFQPYEEFYGPYYEDIPRRVPDLSAAEEILGYRPKVSLEDGLEKTIKWYRDKAVRR
ncbi:MAG: NAD-dependent epimerase/dehydratase family protein [Firmicutes bacterium]|nr:NAD-dependent epimerase/dehydratase family protein [Bacillota bacterium]